MISHGLQGHSLLKSQLVESNTNERHSMANFEQMQTNLTEERFDLCNKETHSYHLQQLKIMQHFINISQRNMESSRELSFRWPML